jgi:hypothetical protein
MMKKIEDINEFYISALNKPTSDKFNHYYLSNQHPNLTYFKIL